MHSGPRCTPESVNRTGSIAASRASVSSGGSSPPAMTTAKSSVGAPGPRCPVSATARCGYVGCSARAVARARGVPTLPMPVVPAPRSPAPSTAAGSLSSRFPTPARGQDVCQQLAHPPAPVQGDPGVGAAAEHLGGVHLVGGAPLQHIGNQPPAKPVAGPCRCPPEHAAEPESTSTGASIARISLRRRGSGLAALGPVRAGGTWSGRGPGVGSAGSAGSSESTKRFSAVLRPGYPPGALPGADLHHALH